MYYFWWLLLENWDVAGYFIVLLFPLKKYSVFLVSRCMILDTKVFKTFSNSGQISVQGVTDLKDKCIIYF